MKLPPPKSGSAQKPGSTAAAGAVADGAGTAATDVVVALIVDEDTGEKCKVTGATIEVTVYATAGSAGPEGPARPAAGASAGASTAACVCAADATA
mmetsp:Transcript_3977/g.14814  ORF Transcript_3977/g.14814 Transcript_3977/m.14814 type:complete len:96 (-) Transcript_3977:297-584(-)